MVLNGREFIKKSHASVIFVTKFLVYQGNVKNKELDLLSDWFIWNY